MTTQPAQNFMSVTEMSTFLHCRHQWWLQSPSRGALQHKGFPPAPLILGTLVHAGLSAHALHLDWNLAVLEAAASYQPQVRFEEDAAYIEKASREACAWIVDYITEYGDDPFEPLQVVASEQSFSLEIDGTGTLVGTFDYLLTDPRVPGSVYLADTKTFSPQNKPTHEKYNLDLQFNTYAWVCKQIFGRCDGFIYDGIEKKHPARFERFVLRPNDAILQNVGVQVRRTFQEAFSPDFYPLRILGWDCNRCPVRDVCFSGLSGEDTEWLVNEKYDRTARGSRSRDAVAGGGVRPVADIRELGS
jgi:hypothetical protein